jgi:hypothetical protein
MKEKIFISYSHTNSANVIPAAQKLFELGFDIWKDDCSLKGGDFWNAEIIHAISTCDFYILFISEISMQSDVVRRQLDLGYQHKRKIIPVRLDDAQIPLDMVYQLTGIQWIDTQNGDWFSRLLVAMEYSSHSNASIPNPSLSAIPTPQLDVHIGDNAVSNIVVTGDHNKVNQDNRAGGVYFAGKANITGDVVGGNQTKFEK